MIIEKTARDTLTAVEMDVDDELRFILADGTTRSVVLKSTWAGVSETTIDPPDQRPLPEIPGAVTNYRFRCHLQIDGVDLWLGREVATPESFYEPSEIMGLRIWFDAVDDIFDFLQETHGTCRPRKACRLAVQDATTSICPVLLQPWCPLPDGGLRVEDAYNGEDVWMGAYFGGSAHGGLDINHPAGTPIWTPIPLDDHYFFAHLSKGDNNNRWRGLHTWPDGSTWVIQVHHVIRLLVDEHQPLPAGTHLAEGAGVLIGAHSHSHFKFGVIEPGGGDVEDAVLLDPWILFREMYLDPRANAGKIAAGSAFSAEEDLADVPQRVSGAVELADQLDAADKPAIEPATPAVFPANRID